MAGERFAVSVGARCSDGCDLRGRELSIYDQQGALVGTVKLGHDVWPGTEALYFAKVETRAPLEAETTNGRRRLPAGMRGCRMQPARSL